MKVYKFGGASVKDAAGVRNLYSIVSRFEGDLLVVVSAMGKTTNALERVVAAMAEGREQDAQTEWAAVIDYHLSIMSDLGLKNNIDLRLPTSFPYDPSASYDKNYDQIVSLGEIMSTQIIAVFLLSRGIPTEWWNTPKLLRTDSTFCEGKVDMATSEQIISSSWHRANRARVVVAQGFIGGNEEGERVTLGREGSDYSAALFAHFLQAESVTIWKDVPGILNADPRIVKQTVLIPELSYNDAVELSYSGAQIIHPKTIRPLENKQIPLYVKPFGNPDAAGSVIHGHTAGPLQVPIFIWKKNQVLLTMRAKDFSFVLEDSLDHIFSIIHDHRLRVSLIQSSAVSVTVCVDRTRYLADALTELSKDYKVAYNEGLSMLTIRNMTPDILAREKEGRELLLCQETRRIARIVVKD